MSDAFLDSVAWVCSVAWGPMIVWYVVHKIRTSGIHDMYDTNDSDGGG